MATKKKEDALPNVNTQETLSNTSNRKAEQGYEPFNTNTNGLSNLRAAQEALRNGDTASANAFVNIQANQGTNSQNAVDKVRESQSYLDMVGSQNKVNNIGAFNYSRQEALDNAVNSILNRGDFNYDINGDSLYNQYKDNYMNLGRLAMQDAMGQASAMTGGYGNSYASSVGNQAYQGYISQLNDVIPQLYSLALDRYNAEGDRIMNQYGILSDDRANEYGLYNDDYNRAVTDRGYYTDMFNNASAMKTDDERYREGFDYQKERDAIADRFTQMGYDLNVANAMADWALSQQQMDFDREKFNEAVKEWQTEYDQSERQFATLHGGTANTSGGGRSGGSGKGGGGTSNNTTTTTTTGNPYTNYINQYVSQAVEKNPNLTDEDIARLLMNAYK